MEKSEIRKLRRELLPFIEVITAIGGTSTQTIFDLVFEEEGRSIEFEEDDSWLARFLARTIIDDLVSDQEPGKMALNVTVKHQKLVRIMATALAQSLSMRALVLEGYHPSLMSAYIFNEFVAMGVDEVDVDFALMIWNVLEKLAIKFGSAERRLADVFTIVRQEVAESMDPSFASFVLISKLGNRKLERMILKNIVSDDDDTESWWQV